MKQEDTNHSVTDYIVSNNILIGTLLKFGGKVLGLAGHLGNGSPVQRNVFQDTNVSAERTGDLLQDSVSLLHSQATATDLLCLTICPLQTGSQQVSCRRHHCNEPSPPNPRKSRNLEIRYEKSAANSRIDDDVAHGVLDMFANLLSAATNILTDIAFIKIKILQGLFSHPDCWVTPKNDNNGCISKLCNDTDQEQKSYRHNVGICSNDQARKWIIDVNQSRTCVYLIHNKLFSTRTMQC